MSDELHDPEAIIRIAICIFEASTDYQDLLQMLRLEDAMVSVLTNNDSDGKLIHDAPEWPAQPVAGSSHASFLEFIRLATTPKLAARLDRELIAGGHLLIIALTDAAHERCVLSKLLSSGARSVHIHELPCHG